jgi:probable rRNA maturation factor
VIPAEVTVRFVDAGRGAGLNRDYRGKDYATNVLSFPYAAGTTLSGDLVLCLPVLEREAREQGKPPEAHCAHLIVHGMLHLQGYDHEAGRADAERMEALGAEILADLGYPDPYA